MKNIIVTTILFIGIISFGQEVQAQNNEKDKVSLRVEGLGCPFCAFGLEKKLKDIDGMKKLEIDIETGEVTFLVPSKNNISVVEVEEQVNKAGYTPFEAQIERASGQVEVAEVKEKAPLPDDAAVVTKTLKVMGKCAMCKNRIERALNEMDAVTYAMWDVDSKILIVSYNENDLSLSDIHLKLASVGHDTDEATADKAVYGDLPACCLYR